MRFSLIKVFAMIGLLAMSCGRSANAPEADDSSSSPSSDEDKPDQSAPVSGAYLTCLAPEPTTDMDYMVAACQVRSADHKHIAEKNDDTRWAYAPPEGKTGPNIEVYDLYDKPGHYFDAMFVMHFPKAGLSLQDGINRISAVDYFLNSVPVLAPKQILLSSVRKTASGTEAGLNLMAVSAKPDPMTFKRHNTAVDTERTMPAEPVAGMRGRPFVLPAVTEVNGLPVLPQAQASQPQGLVITPAQKQQQEALQQQQVQNQLNAQMFSTLISGAMSAASRLPTSTAAPAQTGVVSGPPPAAAGGCTCAGN